MSKTEKQIQIVLREVDGEIYYKEVDGAGAVFGRIKGYRRLAHAAGLKILTPPRLTYNNEDRSNPHIVRDGAKLMEVVSRKIAFGLDYNGEPIAVDQIIVFNPLNYLAKKLLELSVKYPTIASMVNRDSILAKDLKKGMFISVIDSGATDVGVFVPDLGHRELEDVWREYHDSVLYSERNAQTMCERAAIQKHPAIPAFTKSMMLGDADIGVNLISWTLDSQESVKMSNIASRIELGKDVDIKTTVSLDKE